MQRSIITKNKIGIITYFILIIIGILLWSAEDLAPDSSKEHRIAEMVGSFALITISYMIILATRFKKIEDYFGGIDKVFHFHKRLGILALCLIIAHNVLTPAPAEDDLSIGKAFGIIAFLGFILLILLTLFSFILRKYERWLMSHRFTGVFLIIATIHIFIAPKSAIPPSIVGIYLKAIALIGVFAYLYKIVFYGYLKKMYNFTVSKVEKITPNVIDISLTPNQENFAFSAGQYVYISFDCAGVKKETHPFTISGASSSSETLNLTIKAIGDYTKDLYANLKEGTKALIDGPYGRFYNKDTKTKRQVWIAGGIGITPFLSWARSLGKDNDKEIYLVHSIKDSKEALFSAELEKKASLSENFKFFLFESKKDGHLNVLKIKKLLNIENLLDTSVYICGPTKMMKSLQKEFKEHIPKSLIYFEHFSI